MPSHHALSPCLTSSSSSFTKIRNLKDSFLKIITIERHLQSRGVPPGAPDLLVSVLQCKHWYWPLVLPPMRPVCHTSRDDNQPWPLIGQTGSRDLNTGPWLVSHVTRSWWDTRPSDLGRQGGASACSLQFTKSWCGYEQHSDCGEQVESVVWLMDTVLTF